MSKHRRILDEVGVGKNMAHKIGSICKVRSTRVEVGYTHLKSFIFIIISQRFENVYDVIAVSHGAFSIRHTDGPHVVTIGYKKDSCKGAVYTFTGATLEVIENN